MVGISANIFSLLYQNPTKYYKFPDTNITGVICKP